MSRSHLILAERIGIEVFVAMGMSCRTIAACPGPPPQHHFPGAARPHAPLRSGRPNGLRAVCGWTIQRIKAWAPVGDHLPAGSLRPHCLAMPTAVICAAPTDAAGGKAGAAGADPGCIDTARRSQPVAGGSGLRFQGPGSAAQLQGAQESLSAAGQGPKQNGRRLGRGACSAFV